MSFSDTLKAQKYASIAEVAAAQSKLYADKLEAAPDYAAQAAASASLAATSASQAESAALTSINAANSATASAISASNSAEAAGQAAEDAIQNYVDQSVRVSGSETVNPVPAASSRANSVFVWDGASQPAGKLLSEFATLDGTGKIPVSMIPSIALTEPFVVSSQAAMLALNAQVGDIAKRTDLGYSFCLASSPPSTLANWIQLTDDVLAQLGLSSGATMVGAVDDSSNPTTVQGALNLKTSISSLAASTGATLIGATNNAGSTSTVQSVLNLKLEKTELAATDGEKLIGICPSIATLRNIEPTYNGQRITLSEHTVGTGKGGGQFRAVLAGSSYTDNNGTIIKTTGGAAWLRINSEVTNPLMFGAIGTSSADESSAVTSAIRAAVAYCDGIGYTYGVGGTIQLDKSTPIEFRNANLQYITALGTQPMMRMRNSAHRMFKISFNGTGGTTGSGLIWEGASTLDGGLVEQCEFKNVGGAGIRISGDYTNRIFARYGAVRNCRFITCGNTGIANDRCSVIADGVNNFTFDGLIMTGCNWGIYIRMDTSLPDKARAVNNLLQNCHIYGSGRTHPTFTDAQGISANRQDSLKVDNCWVDGFADNGFDCGSSTGMQITNYRCNNCKDAIFIGDIDCDSYVIDNVIARDCDRGVRIVMDGNIQADGIVRNVRIANMKVTNPVYEGFSIRNTGALTGVFDIYLVNCFVDSVSSYSLSTFTYPFRIEGIDGAFLDNCGCRYAKSAGINIKKGDQIQVRGGRLQNIDMAGAASYGVTVESDSNRVSISDVIVYGNSTGGAVILAGGAGHSVKHTRWRSITGGVNTSGATSPYLLDNIAF